MIRKLYQPSSLLEIEQFSRNVFGGNAEEKNSRAVRKSIKYLAIENFLRLDLAAKMPNLPVSISEFGGTIGCAMYR